MATFNYLTHLLFLFLFANGILARGDFLDPEEFDNNNPENQGDSIQENNNPENQGDSIQENNNPENQGDPIQDPAQAASENNANPESDDTSIEKPTAGNEYEKENIDIKEKSNDPQGGNLEAGGEKPRFMDSEELDENDKYAVNDDEEDEEGQEQENADQKSDVEKEDNLRPKPEEVNPKPTQQPSNPGAVNPQQNQNFDYHQYVAAKVNSLFSSPNGIVAILAYADSWDVEHRLAVYKALKNLLKGKKNYDITNKITVMWYIQNHVYRNPSVTQNQRSDSEILYREYYKMVYDQQTEEIKNAIKNRIPMNTPRFVGNTRSILQHDENLSIKIMERSIKELYDADANSLKNLVEGVHQLPMITQSIHGLRAIFHEVSARNEWNKRYKDVFELAKSLRSKEYSPNFYEATPAARTSYYYMKENLPYSVKNLIWNRGSICFKNLDTFKYLYAANLTAAPVVSTLDSLFLIQPLPQDGLWKVVEKSESFQIFNLLYGRYLAGDSEESKGAKPVQSPDDYEIIPRDDMVMIKNLRTKKYLKEIGVYMPVMNKVGPVNSEAITDKSLWVVEDCGAFNQIRPHNQMPAYNQMVPLNPMVYGEN